MPTIKSNGLTATYDDARLVVTCTKKVQKQIQRLRRERSGAFDGDQTMVDLFEELVANSELQWVDPADTGDLTSAPMLGILGETTDTNEGPFGAQCVGAWDEDGGPVLQRYQPIVQRWGFMDYQVRSVQQDLADTCRKPISPKSRGTNMAWSWSHSPEAYSDARENVFGKNREWLEVVWAEWQAAIPHPEHGIGFHADLDLKKYEALLGEAKALSDEVLAEQIWERAEELATCTNGGWEAWCCPFGCGCHMVPFDLDGEASG